jgi:hypothetical protein
MFSTTFCTNHLCGALNNTKKKLTSPPRLFAKMCEFLSELAAAGKPVEEDEMIGYVLNGLDSFYNDLVSSVNVNPNTTFDELYSLIHAHDLRCGMLAKDEQEPSSPLPTPSIAVVTMIARVAIVVGLQIAVTVLSMVAKVAITVTPVATAVTSTRMMIPAVLMMVAKAAAMMMVLRHMTSDQGNRDGRHEYYTVESQAD